MSGFSPPSAEVHTAVHALLSEFGWRVDNALGATVAELFVEDGALATPNFELAGKDRIHAHFSERATKGDRISRHFSTNVRITPAGDNRYEVSAYALTVVSTPPAPAKGALAHVGTSFDVIVRTEAGWLFESRRLSVVVEAQIPAQEKAA